MTPHILLMMVIAVATTFGLSTSARASGAESGERVLLAQAPGPASLAARREGDDIVLGAANARVTVIEYASLTCPHCARFHDTTLPKLKSEYIDKGLVKFVYRDFPLDLLALRGAMLARCAGPERYFPFLDALFKQQRSWALADEGEAMAALRKLARLSGMPEQTFDACLKDQAVETAILQAQLRGNQEFKVNSTPTLIINGAVFPGALSFEALERIVKPLLGPS